MKYVPNKCVLNVYFLYIYLKSIEVLLVAWRFFFGAEITHQAKRNGFIRFLIDRYQHLHHTQSKNLTCFETEFLWAYWVSNM